MTKRGSLLIGSLPFEDEETCMRRALDALGSSLWTLPDGEIGDKTPQFPRGNRIAWVMYAVERLTADPQSWEIVKEPCAARTAWPSVTMASRNSNRYEALRPCPTM